MISDEERFRRALNATPEEQRRLDDLADALGRPSVPVYLVAGGTPAARWLAEALEDPARRAELEEQARRFAEALGLALRPVIEAMLRAAEAYGQAFRNATAHLREVGVLPEAPPTDPRERALWVRRHRGTGPDRQLQRQHRPRRHS